MEVFVLLLNLRVENIDIISLILVFKDGNLR